ncbi:MAG: TolC family protein, partial [Kiritimatiellia bacterium]|nr:TolC family protein [Kiritimatiellia bacterium]
ADYGLNDDQSFIPHNKSWSVGTSIGLDIFNGGQTIFALRAAHAQQRSTEAQLTSADNTIYSTLEEKFTNWQNADDRVRLQAQLLEAAEVRMEIARIKYSNGLMTFQDWDYIENELITNQKNMLSTERNAIIAQAEWEKAVGMSVVP